VDLDHISNTFSYCKQIMCQRQCLIIDNCTKITFEKVYNMWMTLKSLKITGNGAVW